MAGASDTNIYKHYVPSVAAAIAFAAIFGALTIAHFIFIIARKRKFPIIIVIGGLFEIIGHISRAISHFHLSSIPAFSVQSILILLAPILFAAGIYMFLGRLIRASGYSDLSPVRTTWITKIFLFGDIFCFFVQAVGAGKLIKPKNPHDVESGQNIILGGLVLQIIIFAFFVIVTVIFHRRFRNEKVGTSKDGMVEQQLWSLYICSLLISVRSIFRLAEYKGGQDGYLMKHEWPVYTFDVALMAAVMAISMNWYRGRLDEMDGHTDIPLHG
ncbi:RTA1 like protein [Polyplosphaeria fusca]|uniref:RTA1 like protein n=1 Tax=Polyplosphaeria fusca TaxID=682080 RepID=A0A9P4QJP4_9PLEO|nr:RTA1 like protein [Polyplosphaeria fusca]